MGVKWVTFLNNGANIGDNDYLVKKLTDAGIEPVMRIYSPTLQPLQGDIEGMVRHYTALGVHYFQPFNEPNLNCENPGRPGVGRSVSGRLDSGGQGDRARWRPARLRRPGAGRRLRRSAVPERQPGLG